MWLETYTIKRAHSMPCAVKLWLEMISGTLEGFFPDKKYLVNGAKGIDLKFIIRILSSHKQLYVVVFIDERVPLGQSCFDKWFFNPIPNVQIIIIP